jgi:hypothetical protein
VESVCYTRATVGSNEAATERRDHVIALTNTGSATTAEPEPEPHTAAHAVTPRPIYVAADHTPNHPTQSINIGPIDYSNYLKRQYPKLVSYRLHDSVIDLFSSMYLILVNEMFTVAVLKFFIFLYSTDG